MAAPWRTTHETAASNTNATAPATIRPALEPRAAEAPPRNTWVTDEAAAPPTRAVGSTLVFFL